MKDDNPYMVEKAEKDEDESSNDSGIIRASEAKRHSQDEATVQV